MNVMLILIVDGQRRDNDPRCKDWADDGQCTKNPLYMIPECQVSCHGREAYRYDRSRR